MENKLKSAVLAKYFSITAFAKALRWDRKKASRIVNRVQAPSVDDMYLMADALCVDDSDTFVNIFLPELTTKWGE